MKVRSSEASEASESSDTPKGPKPDEVQARWYIHDVAREYEVHEITARNWQNQGAPYKRDGRRLWCEPERMKAWIESRGREPGVRGRAPGGGGPPNEERDEARLRRERALADKAELDVAERRRLLMPREEVIAMATGCLHEIRAAFVGLAARVTPRVVGQDGGTVHGIIDSEVRRILERLADGMDPLVDPPVLKDKE